MKGIVITKLIVIVAIIIAVIYFLSQGNITNISLPGATKATTIKSTEQASKQITEIGTGVDNVGSILADIDKRIG